MKEYIEVMMLIEELATRFEESQETNLQSAKVMKVMAERLIALEDEVEKLKEQMQKEEK